MQAFAWGKMIVDYSAEKGLVAGVKDTFDGQHPCELCGTIAKAKKDTSKNPDVPLSSEYQKLELKQLFPTELLTAKTPRSDEFTLPHHLEPVAFSPRFRQSPDTPPPRLG